jgi:formiminotetrahydrofolate cyclodeaminase
MTLRDQPLGAFLAQAASSSPTPGGGALAAVGGALGAAMIAMTARLTEGRKQYEAVQAEVAALAAASDRAREALLDLADADAAAYDAVMGAMRLPRGDEAERTARAAALQAAMIEATNVPAAVVARCQEVLGLAETAAAITNRNALGDVATGAFLAEAGMRAAAVQAELNLASIADAAFSAAMAEQLRPAAAGAPDRLAGIVATVRRRAAERP